MAHKSKKKHIKHLHQHEAAAPKSRAKSAAKVSAEASPKAKRPPASRSATARPAKTGLVRSIARRATKKLAAKPKGLIRRATARVKSLFGKSEAA